MTYEVTEELKSQVKIGRLLYLSDFMFAIVWLFVIYMLSSFVASPLKVPYYIFSALVFGWLISPSLHNKKRRTWQAIILYFKHDRTVYRQRDREVQS